MPLPEVRDRTSAAIRATAVVLTLMAASCSTQHSGNPPQPSTRPLPSIDSTVWDARGTIVESEPLRDLEADALAKVGEAHRAVYRSVSATDQRGSEVSGTFFIPKGQPPKGGWPVISFAHGTTGLTTDCGPSAYPDLKGYASSVTSFVDQGFAVAFTDYQGLGHAGIHPYLEPRTAAFNVIDAVRALRAQFPDVSTTWMALGGSQGGQASWAAAEYAHDYGAGLDLVGSIAMVPPADLSGLADAASKGTLTEDQIGLMPSIVAGLEAIDPALVESDYLRGAAVENKQAYISCMPDSEKATLHGELDAEEVRPATPTAANILYALLLANALPQRPLSAPLLVINGGDDNLIPAQWVSAAVSRACSLGGTVQHIELAGRGHLDVDPGEDGYRWAQDRFAGKPAPSNCGTEH